MNIKVIDRCMYGCKRFGGLFLCMALLVALVGCNVKNNNNNSSTPSATAEPTQQVLENIDVKSLATELFEAGDYVDELTELDVDMFDVVFQTLDLQLVNDKAAYVGSAASAEQIVVVEAKDDASAEQVKEQLEQKLKDDIDQNQDYLPQEVSKLKKPVLMINGKYVVLCISNDNDKIEQVLLKKGIMS